MDQAFSWEDEVTNSEQITDLQKRSEQVFESKKELEELEQSLDYIVTDEQDALCDSYRSDYWMEIDLKKELLIKRLLSCVIALALSAIYIIVLMNVMPADVFSDNETGPVPVILAFCIFPVGWLLAMLFSDSTGLKVFLGICSFSPIIIPLGFISLFLYRILREEHEQALEKKYEKKLEKQMGSDAVFQQKLNEAQLIDQKETEAQRIEIQKEIDALSLEYAKEKWLYEAWIRVIDGVKEKSSINGNHPFMYLGFDELAKLLINALYVGYELAKYDIQTKKSDETITYLHVLSYTVNLVIVKLEEAQNQLS